MPARNAEHFLEDYDGRSLPWPKPAGAPMAFETERILFGNGDNALEVAIASATRPGQPKAEDLRALFKKRQANRPAPVLLVVSYTGPGDQPFAAVIGTIGDPGPVTGLGIEQGRPYLRCCARRTGPACSGPVSRATARWPERPAFSRAGQLRIVRFTRIAHRGSGPSGLGASPHSCASTARHEWPAADPRPWLPDSPMGVRGPASYP